MSDLIAQFKEEQKKLRESILLMKEKVVGVGNPITIPHQVNEPTKQFIKHLEAGINDLEEALHILERG